MALKRRLDRVLIFLRRHGVVGTAREVGRRLAGRIMGGRRPDAVQLEVSNCCNLHCEYCVLDESGLATKVMPVDLFESLLPELKCARRIDLSGLAEPLMNRHLPEMIAAARAQAPHAHIAIATNATLLTPDLAEKLVRAGLDELVFSLDGIDAEQIDAIRKGGSLCAVLDNVREQQRVKARLGSATPVLTATVVLHEANAAQLASVVTLAAELGCEGVSVNGLEPYSASLVGEALWVVPGDAAGLAADLRAAQEAADAAGIELRLPAMRPQTPLCPQIARPIVLADGTVVPCSVLAYERPSLVAIAPDLTISQRELRVAPLSFGNAADGLSAVWNSPAYRQYRKRVTSGDFPPQCDACLLKYGVVCAVPPLTAEQSAATIPSEDRVAG